MDAPTARPPVLLLYGYDHTSHDFEVTSTRALVDAMHSALLARGWAVTLLNVDRELGTLIEGYDPASWLVFNVCEGSPNQPFYYAEVAKQLGARGFTFTGSDFDSLDQTQLKWVMKRLMADAGVPTPAWAVCDEPHRLRFSAFPAIVKPAAEHCSYGITRESVVTNLSEARAQVRRIVSSFSAPALIEQFCDSDEYNISIWGDRAPEVLGISMMTYGYFADIHDRLCTFDAKWTPESEAYQKIPAVCPAPVTPELKAQLEQAALAAYRAGGVRDYGRVDLRLLNGVPMVLDINGNCDISNEGGFFNAARAAGLNYGEMLERILMFAVARMPQAPRAQMPLREAAGVPA
jgi:D-alanine-D-alanine ligase